jgi:hypothetical protein
MTRSSRRRETELAKTHSSWTEITISDLEPLVVMVCANDDDEEIRSYCQDRLRFRISHLLPRINGSITELRSLWPDATQIEVFVGFDLCQESMDALLESLATAPFRQKVRIEAIQRLSPSSPPPTPHRRPSARDLDDFDNSDEDDDFVAKPTKTKSSRAFIRCPAEAMVRPDEVSPENWARWSEARRKSYLHVDEHPGAYYYRHNPGGEVQRNGNWSAEEKRLFLERMKEIRGSADTFSCDWGSFSLAIPGRVGYQCSNFYRKLVEAGELTDSRYIIGTDGKLHHTTRIHDTPRKEKTVRKHFKHPIDFSEVTSLNFTSSSEYADQHKVSNPKKGAEPKAPPKPKAKGLYDRWAMDNPLPEAVDTITGEVIRVPAMSPDGYVLDYNTWLDLIPTTGVDPFTQKRLNKRQLIVLNTENFSQYADKIMNL